MDIYYHNCFLASIPELLTSELLLLGMRVSYPLLLPQLRTHLRFPSEHTNFELLIIIFDWLSWMSTEIPLSHDHLSIALLWSRMDHYGRSYRMGIWFYYGDMKLINTRGEN